MAVEVQSDTPLAEALQNATQTKLAEMGWTSGGLDDSALAEYIVLMVVNGKTKEEVASELSSDLLDDSAAISAAPDFARWLFQRLEQLGGQSNGAMEDQAGMHTEASTSQQPPGGPHESTGGMVNSAPNDDANMGNDEADESIPTGPKSMRSGRTKDRRLLGQMNKALDRSGDPALHRIKGAAGGAGRVNSHSREPPKGPAGSAPRGPRATMTRLANQQPLRKMNQMNEMAPGPNNPFTNMTQQQQIQLFAMYEQQAKMMSQIFGPQQQQQMMSGQGGSTFGPNAQTGKSLFDRVDSRGPRQNGHSARGTAHVETGMNGDLDLGSSMEVEPSSQGPRQDPSTTMCRFNLSCTKADCHFVHQSPAAPPGTAIDMTDTCSFGAACKNRKCTAKHPSPGKLGPLQAAQDCKYYPNCTNPICPFQHPTMPPCRNGSDCTVTGCKFFHSKVPCKFDPCLNPSCPYKHVDGQKRGSYADKVWVNNVEGGEDGKEHVSNRKFVDETAGDEELIRPQEPEPEPGLTHEAPQPDGIVT